MHLVNEFCLSLPWLFLVNVDVCDEIIVDSSELSSLGGASVLDNKDDGIDACSVADCMNRKLRILYHLNDVVSGLKSAKLTCAQPYIKQTHTMIIHNCHESFITLFFSTVS